jgi:hypothetical protein
VLRKNQIVHLWITPRAVSTPEAEMNMGATQGDISDSL